MTYILTAEIEGDQQLSRELGITATRVKDFRRPLRESAAELQKTFQLNFDARGRLFGGWKDRKPVYDHGQRVDTWPLLEKTGRMRKSFFSEVHDDHAVLGNRTPYFKYHQSNKDRTRLPRRVMMMIDDARRRFIIRAFQEHIIESTRGLR